REEAPDRPGRARRAGSRRIPGGCAASRVGEPRRGARGCGRRAAGRRISPPQPTTSVPAPRASLAARLTDHDTPRSLPRGCTAPLVLVEGGAFEVVSYRFPAVLPDPAVPELLEVLRTAADPNFGVFPAGRKAITVQ